MRSYEEREPALNGLPFPTSSETAAAVGAALRANNSAAADRLITERFGRIINASGAIPEGAVEKPESTGDERYDTLLAVGLSYALATHGLAPAAWMEATPGLKAEWLWDGDAEASPAYREYVHQRTPQMFLEKGILLRDRDLGTA